MPMNNFVCYLVWSMDLFKLHPWNINHLKETIRTHTVNLAYFTTELKYVNLFKANK